MTVRIKIIRRFQVVKRPERPKGREASGYLNDETVNRIRNVCVTVLMAKSSLEIRSNGRMERGAGLDWPVSPDGRA